ncbi:TPA: hypothetical protein ACIIUJ_004873 [Klebsiella aerogenes]|uniref:hypothetical protein n=1 Tax=Klebsiella aerogenes TaxID=548 RepID=UPI00277C4360|nr:hypothetical protein [Klebsiella aerogenes]HCS4252320.1 hypothetical protein [Klebsiella aerogenes]HDS8024574.1 hypothetical protein [Klebsiella aerogenes]
MKHVYMVMDSRAQFDIDRASVLECCGNKQPSWKSLLRDWGEQGAVLVRFRVVANTNGEVATAPEIVGVID